MCHGAGQVGVQGRHDGSARTERVKDMKVGREKDYLGDRVVLTSMP